jgi:hypothetical protein
VSATEAYYVGEVKKINTDNTNYPHSAGFVMAVNSDQACFSYTDTEVWTQYMTYYPLLDVGTYWYTDSVTY